MEINIFTTQQFIAKNKSGLNINQHQKTARKRFDFKCFNKIERIEEKVSRYLYYAAAYK
jgi:hypothetical protein